MTETQFFAAVDTLSQLENRQFELMRELSDVTAEIVSITEDFENLILEGNRELKTDGGKKYFIDLRLFAGLGGADKTAAEEIIKRFTGTA